MSGYSANDDYDDPAKAYFQPLQDFASLLEARARIENNFRAAYEDLVVKYRNKCDEYDRERRNAALWEKEQRMAEKELTNLKSRAESASFAYVIIDGDGALFRADLIARGEEGGSTAAHQLLADIKDHLQEKYNLSHIEVFVQVVLSMEGLSKALFNAGLMKDDRAGLVKFARGFCRAQPLFSFVDVGYGKEQADNKIRKLFELMERNIHCRALILGGCHDNGYATFLEAFRSNKKISLLETTPAAADFRKLPFTRITFPSVFRADPLPRAVMPPPGFVVPVMRENQAFQSGNQVYSPAFSSPLSPAPTTQASPVFAPASAVSAVMKSPTPVSSVRRGSDARPGSWASVGRTAGAPQVIDISTQKKTAAKERLFYQLNKDDERVDPVLPKTENAARESFDEKTKRNGANFCNRFHLFGQCKQMDKCPYVHGERLSSAEQIALKYRARGLPCNAGYSCTDVFCTSGHHCINPKGCWYDDACRFSDMHGMDTTPTIKIFEDGSREVLV